MELYHRIDQALVSVPQIGRQPSWSLVEGFRGPLAVWQVYRFESFIFCRGILEPAKMSVSPG